MSKFTCQKSTQPILVTLGEYPNGRVQIMVETPDEGPYCVAVLCDGKLRLPRFNTESAKQMGLKLDDNACVLVEPT